MKLRNKRTGEIVIADITRMVSGVQLDCGQSLAELNEEWEDVSEKQKGYWCIDWTGGVNHITVLDDVDKYERAKKEIGNYFETEKEAERAMEKLKAWKRLKDNGISFDVKIIDRKWYLEPKSEPKERTFSEAHDLFKDVMLVFGGEE